MKKFTIILIAIFFSVMVFGQSNEEPCITCNGNKIDFTNGASAIGARNESSGTNSFAVGFQNNAIGNYSFSAGYKSNALGDYSMAFGKTAVSNGIQSFAFGLSSEASGNASMAIGSYTLTNNSALLSIAFGSKVSALAERNIVLGYGLYDDPIENNISNSMMIGFNSNRSTFFVSPSDGIGTTGRIGIGDVTNPLAKLHIRADETEDAIIKLETTGANQIAQLILADDDNTITAMKDGGMIFHTTEAGNFKFNNGNLGIGLNISNPLHRLHVNGNIMIDDDESSLLFAGDSKTDWGEWGIEYENGGLNFWKPAGSNNFGNYFLFLADDGNVGIGINNPSKALEVDGDIKFTGDLYDHDVLFEASPWEHNDNGIFYTDGNVGVGTSASADQKLEVAGDILVDGSINFTEALLQNGQPFEATKWVENALGLFYNDGFVGIGTDNPGEKLEVAGNIIAQAIDIDDFKMATNGFGEGKLLQSDALGNANWVAPPETDDGDWTISGENVYRDGGKVGIGTIEPTSHLHIKSLTGNVTTSFLEIENDGNGVFGSGSTTIGKWEGSGPFIMQKAGTGPYYSGDEGLRLAFVQNNKNNITGLSISTYMNYDGSVHYSDIYAENGWLYLRSSKELFIRSGGNSPIVFETNGDNTDQGTQRMEINRYGQVGIGTTQHEDQSTLLTVAGRIHAQEVKVTAGAGTGADFVFDDDYDLPGIDEVASFIKSNKHLPDIPSAEEMQNEGLDLGEMQIKLLQKIEELTLYVIDLKKENEEMRKDNCEMKNEIEKLKRR